MQNTSYFKRKNIRLEGYNYSEPGYYFITICTDNKQNYLAKIEKEKIIYSEIGKLVINGIENLPRIYSSVKMDKYVVMPNHIHMILIINKKTDLTISRIIRQYKETITKTLHQSIWQKSYFDHIIRNEKDYYRIWKYIDENVLKWQLDVYYKD